MSFAPGWGRNTDGDKDTFKELRNELEEEKIRVPYKGLPDEALIDKSKIDPVKPDHYDGRKCMEIISEVVKDKPPDEAFCIGNTIKYLYRYNRKKGIEDVKKAGEYITMLVELLEKK